MKTLRKPRVTASAGFTLIELMVTIVIATVLATIAIPSYQAQIRKSRRTDAKTALLDLAGREERYNSTHNQYSSTPTDLGYAAFPATVGSNYYQININVCAGPLPCTTNAATGAFFSATAVAQSPQTKDAQCLNFTLDSTGAQGVSGAAIATPGDCWN
jgi:type IV pilus assembly protein PilE